MSLSPAMITSSEPQPGPGPTIPDAHPDTCLQEGQYESTVPNVADRVAQTAAAVLLERELEPVFHSDSYGYRPGRSAHDALGMCRWRCWKKDWGAPG
jgi:retron-type reverse transcriptase